MTQDSSGSYSVPRWSWFVAVAGAYLTLRGYHSFDGDQAYRLPLLLRLRDPSLYATDPFVRAFDAFNPHRGYLALLAAASRPFGVATGLAVLFGLTLAATMVGVDRLARLAWPGRGGRVGLVAVVLVLIAKAGNVGTNHLFEGTLLDRLVAFALGWLALAAAVGDPRRGARWAAPLLGLATLIHPSVGLQVALTLGASWLFWAVGPGRGEVSRLGALGSALALGVALLPGLALVGGQGGRLLEGMPLDEFRQWAVRVQGPQHMLPSTWRFPQWLAAGCYPILAGLGYLGRDRTPAARRLGVLLLVNLASLTLAYVAVEVVADLRATLFQPFRMATLGRGVCLILAAGRVLGLWDRGDLIGRGRATLIAVGLAGDWTLVVATAVDLAMALVEACRRPGRGAGLVGGLVLVGGLIFLARHDTESGQVALVGALAALAVGTGLARIRPLGWNRRRLAYVLIAAWAVPALAWGAGLFGGDRPPGGPLRLALLERCRFAEIAVDPAERVGRWCREHTPAASRFVGPPGEKGFRLWSRRPLAFNRAGSPYHAAGLLDWSERFRAHVGFEGSAADFAHAYLAGRHALEANYGRMAPAGKLALARGQGATHVLERFPAGDRPPDLGPGLELLHVDAGYAVYRVR